MLRVAVAGTPITSGVLFDAVPELGKMPVGTSTCEPTYTSRDDTSFMW